jgi:ubiquinone biosynthesis protein Coq4
MFFFPCLLVENAAALVINRNLFQKAAIIIQRWKKSKLWSTFLTWHTRVQLGAQARKAEKLELSSSAISVEKLMDDLRMITLNLDRDFDAWKPEDSQSLADTLAESAGVAKEHVKILDCQRGSVIASTIILAADWVVVAEKLKTSLMDESGSLKNMGVVGCAGLMGCVVGKPPRTLANASAPVVPAGGVPTMLLGSGTGAERHIEMCKRVVQGMLRHQLLMAWNMFVDTVRETQHNRETVRKVLSRMTHRRLAQAFDCYAGAVHTVLAQREKVARTVARWRNPGLKRVWEAWAEYLEIMRSEQAQEALELAKQQLEASAKEKQTFLFLQNSYDEKQSMAETEAERRIEMCKRVVQRMLRHQLLMAWNMFVDTVRETQHNRETVRKVLSRMTHRRLAQAFDCYAGAVHTVLAQRKACVKDLLQVRTQEALELAKQQLEASALQKQSMVETEAKRRIEMCKRVVQHMLKHQLLMAWNMFVDTVRETQHNRETVSKVLSRMQHRQLAGAFDCYAGAVEMLVAQRKALARMMAVWRTPGLKKAWEAWAEYLEIMHGVRAQEALELAKQQLEEAAREKQSMAETEAERRLEMCKRVVQRMLRHQLLMAWNMFVDTVRETQHNRETVRKVLSRMTHRRLAQAFDCYAGAVHTVLAQRKACVKDLLQVRTQEALELAKQQLEASALQKQSMVETEAKRRIEMCKRVVQHMLKHQLLMAWNMFVDTVRETQHNRETVSKVLSRMQHRQLAQAFDCYVRAVEALVVQRRRKEDVCSKVITRLMCRSLAVACDRWREHGREQRQMKTMCSRIVTRWLGKILNLYFDAWISRVDNAKDTAHMDGINKAHEKTIVQKEREINVLKQQHTEVLQKLESIEKPFRDALEATSNKLGQRDSAIDRMRLMVSKLQETLSQDVLNFPHEQDATGLHSRTTLGILLNCCIIDRLVLGGPAWKSKLLKIGDEIVKVNGIRADRANIHELLIGDDVPGSSVSITLKTDGWHGLGKTVELKRMSAIAIADRVRMFELFSSMKARAKEDKDTRAAALVDLSIDLWTAMLSADAEHELKVASKVLQMQESCEAIVDDMDKLLSCSLSGTDNRDEPSTSAYQDRIWQQTAARALGDLQEGTTTHLAQRLRKESSHETERNVIRQLLEQASVTFDERHQARRLCDDACTPSTSTRQSGGNHNDRRRSGGSDKDSRRTAQTNSSETNREPQTKDAAQRERPRSYPLSVIRR